MVAIGCRPVVRCEGQPVLRMNLLADLLVDVGNLVFLADLEEPAPSLRGDVLEDLLAVGKRNALRSRSPAAWVASWIGARIPTGIAAGVASTGIAASVVGIACVEAAGKVGLLTFEVDDVDDGARALGCLDR